MAVTCQGMYSGYVMTDRHDAAPEPAPDEELFVTFANTLAFHDGRPDERLPDGATLAGWLALNGVLNRTPSRSAAERALPAYRELRGLVHDVTERLARGSRPSAGQVRRLNTVLREGLHYHELRSSEDGGFTVAPVGDELDQGRAAIAGSLAHFLADHDVGRVRICADDGCRWRFIDRSPAGRRRWCDMNTCGNRAKVARHRARNRAPKRGSAGAR